MLKNITTADLKKELARRNKPTTAQVLTGLKNELKNYKQLEKRALICLNVKVEYSLDVSTISLSNAKEMFNQYKLYLNNIQDEVSLINSQVARKLHKDMDDCLNGSYSFIDEL